MNMNSYVRDLIQYSILLKLYHWKTKSYARHIASDQLYKDLIEFTDQIVEYYQGRNPLLHIDHRISLYNITDDKVVAFLTDLHLFISLLSISNKGILNKRDELLGNIDKTLYLFTLK
jgi:Family of unknown function (DUF5856)